MLNLYPPSAHDIHRGAKLSFPAEIDSACHEINKACLGLGTDEKALTAVLGPKTPNERYLISLRYKELYNQPLRALMKEETSGDYSRLLKLISVSLPEAEADLIRIATKGFGVNEKLIYPVIMGRTNVEIKLLKKAFFDMNNKDLNVVLDSALSGDFHKVITAALQCSLVDFNPNFHTREKAEKDADELYKAGEGKWGTNEKPFIKILVSSPPQHLRNLNVVYSKKYKSTLVQAIENEFSGEAKKALLFLVRMSLEPLEFLAEFFESTMKGFGTDEDSLSAAVVRYHCILPEIKEAYKKKYNKDLRERIHGEAGGEYRKLLLGVFDTPAQ